jgi:hypothetical protein
MGINRPATLAKLIVGAVYFVLACSLTGNASAADNNENEMFHDPFVFYLGGFFPQVRSTIRLDGQIIGEGNNISFENTLGLEDSKSVLWGGARWRISRRNMVEFEFANLNRDGSVTVVTDPIEVGDSIAQAGARIDSFFDITLGRLTYGFSIRKDEKKELMLKGGLHIADIGVGLQLAGAVCVDGEVPPNCSVFGATPRLESDSVTAPLPHLGGAFIYALTPSVALRFQVLGFALEINDIDGSLFEVDADIIWHPWEHFGLGAGLRYFNVNIEAKKSRGKAEFDFEYYGPAIYGVMTF